MLVSIYKNAKDTIGRNIELEKVVENIRTGGNTLIQTTEKCRKLKDNKDAYRVYKETSVPAFMPSGTFKQGNRNDDGIDSPSGLVVIDIDHLMPKLVPVVKSAIDEDLPQTVMSFISPSGVGIKALILVDPVPQTADDFKLAWATVRDHIENSLQIKVDGSGKNFSRLCFLAHDDTVFYNPDAESLKWAKPDEVWERKQTTTYPPVRHQTPDNEQPTEKEVDEWLEHANPDCSHDEWLGVGMTLYAGGYSCNVWESWSRGGTKYQDGECEKRWKSFDGSNAGWGQIVNLAKQGGWTPPQKYSGSPKRAETQSYASVLNEPEELLPALKVDEELSAPDFWGDYTPETLFVGGFDILHSAYADTHVWSPEMLMAMGISAVGYCSEGVFVQTGENSARSRLNTYALAIGHSDYTAKSGAATELKTWLSHVDTSFNAISNLESAQGLMKAISSDEVSSFCIFDEVSIMFENTRRVGTRNLLSQLGEIWLCPINHTTGRGESGGGITSIESPYLCCWGNIPIKTVTSVFEYADITSGLLNRWMPFYISPKVETMRHPHAIAEAYNVWVQIIKSIRSYNNRSLIFSKDADNERFEWYSDIRRKGIESDDDTGLSRIHTQAVKLAGIFAVTENTPHDNTITVDQWRRALHISNYIKNGSDYLFKGVSSGKVGEIESKILDVLNRNGNEMSMSDLTAKTRGMNAKERNEVLDALQKAGQVITYKEKAATRPKNMVRRIE